MSNKKGKIDISKLKTPPSKHELDVARFFSDLGCDIEFIPPSNIPGFHLPDILMLGVEWEIKTPVGKSKNTIKKNMRLAIQQSHYIIFDLRKRNYNESKSLSELNEQISIRPYIKKVLVILKGNILLELPEKK